MQNTRRYNQADLKPYTLIVNGQLMGFFSTHQYALKHLAEIKAEGPWKIYQEDRQAGITTVDEGFRRVAANAPAEEK